MQQLLFLHHCHYWTRCFFWIFDISLRFLRFLLYSFLHLLLLLLRFSTRGGALRFFFEFFLAFFAGFTRVCGLRRFLDTSVSSKPCAFAVNSLCSSKCANLDASSSQLQLQPSGDEATSLALHSSHFLHCRNASSSLDYATSREPEASHQSPERWQICVNEPRSFKIDLGTFENLSLKVSVDRSPCAPVYPFDKNNYFPYERTNERTNIWNFYARGQKSASRKNVL